MKHVPRQILPMRVYSFATWVSGSILSILFWLVILGVYHVHPWMLTVFAFERVLWIGRYMIGLHQILKHARLRRRRKLVLYIVFPLLVPVVELLNGLAVFWAIASPPKTFEVTQKRIDITT